MKSSKSTKSRASASRKPRKMKRVLTVTTFEKMDAEDREYWQRQTPQARLRAMELLRRINYGKAAAGRLQRILEVVQRP